MRHQVLKFLVYHVLCHFKNRLLSLFLLDETLVLEACGVHILARNYSLGRIVDFRMHQLHSVEATGFVLLVCVCACVCVRVCACVHENY